MGKKKSHLSIFSTIIQQINEPSNEYHLIDNEYFPAFNSIDDIEKFHQKINEKQQEIHLNDDNQIQDMDMKTFAHEYLVDLPDKINKISENLNLSQEFYNTSQSINWSPKKKDNKKRKSTIPVKLNNKKSRENLRQSNEFIFTSDNNHSSTNIFDCLQDQTTSNDIEQEKINSILLTLNNNSKKINLDENYHIENPITTELAESSIIKNESIESEQLTIETKEEPIELNITSTNPMDFGTSNYFGDLDNYVQNIHLLHQTSSRPKRIRKQKKFYIEESESIIKPKKLKTPIRKKRPPPLPSSSEISLSLPLTDAEIEQQFGERLSSIKSEHDDNRQQMINSQVIIEFEPVIYSSQTPIEKARAKLTNALERGREPDTYLLKIRSREHKIIEVQLAIYSTTDWYSYRTKILSKIEEALRGLRVSWTKIDIRVDHFDIQISTSSSQTSSIIPSSSISNTNSSWFLKILSESNPLIVHIHDRRYPQQRFFIKCSCSECSPTYFQSSIHSSLPVIVNVSPVTTPTRHLNPPTILNKTLQNTNISSLHNIHTTFFNELISQWGRNIIISVTQCVLDLALIVSVHTCLPNLYVSPTYSNDEYKKKYQEIIDPLKNTFNENEQIFLSNTSMIARIISMNSMNNTQSIIISKSPDIIQFYNTIKTNKANIRSAKSMRNLITTLFSSSVTSPTQSNLIKNQTLILPKPISSVSQTELPLIEANHRIRRHSSRTYSDNNELKQQAHCTPIIELKPIMNRSTSNIQSFIKDNKETRIVRDLLNNEITNNARVIRLSITKSAQQQQIIPSNSLSPPTIRLVPSPKSDSSVEKNETVPLIPKQINIIKPLSTSSSTRTPAIKLSNPVLIHNKFQQPSTK